MGRRGWCAAAAVAFPVAAVAAVAAGVASYGATHATIVAIVAIVMAGIAAVAMSVSREIAATCMIAAAIADGDHRRRFPVLGHHDAVDRQAAALNHMLDRLDERVESLWHVSGDIAHDLRAPLVTLRGRLALIARRPDEDDRSADDRSDLATAVEECDRILALFAAILRIGEIDDGARRAQFAPIDLAVLLDDAGATMAGVAEDGGRSLTIGTLPTAATIGDARLLTQAILHLIDNAIRHTPPGALIDLNMTIAGDRATITIADDGPGIAAADRATALRRFGRLDPSRSGPGHGLGLPMVAAIVRLHEGTLTLGDTREAAPRPGLAATIVLPLTG